MNRFTIIERDNCVLVEGALPPKWIAAIASAMPKTAVISPQLAGMLGANFAFGLQKDVDALIAKIGPDVERAVKQSTAGLGLSDAAQRWLASGQRGNSSETIFTHLTGVDANRGSRSHPYDPDDLRRCRLLLEQCPELVPLFPKMAEVSDAWAGLVRDWETICKTMDDETPEWRAGKGRASETYKLMNLATGRK